jgi:hypothetical protein
VVSSASAKVQNMDILNLERHHYVVPKRRETNSDSASHTIKMDASSTRLLKPVLLARNLMADNLLRTANKYSAIANSLTQIGYCIYHVL